MEPERALVIESVQLPDGKWLQRWTFVWRLEPGQGEKVAIEHRNRQYRIPARCLVASPAPSPSRDRLLTLDPCYAGGRVELTEVYSDEKGLFAVYRCPHDHYFLEDVRGGIAMYSRWIFLGPLDPPDADACEALWHKYHALPDDAIAYLGIGGPRPGV